jgi:PAS domain S-box-containing protein
MNTKNYRSRGKARVLLNLLSDPAAIVDGKGDFLTVNDAFQEVTGLSRKELIGNPFFELNILSAESKAVLLENLKKRIQGAHVEPYEVCFTAKAGENRCVEVKGKKVSYAGQPANLVVFHDVTLRKENARRLKEYSDRMEALVEEKVKEIQDREEKYRKLFDESLDAIFVADAETGIIVDCNPAASLLVGRDKPELIGQHQSILHPQTLVEAGFTKGFKEHVKSPMRPRETQVVTKTGEIKYVSVRANVFELQGKKLMQGTFRDITERKLMQQALQENEEKFHGIANSVRDATILVDDEAKVTYWNPAAEKTFGYTSTEAIGKDVHELVVPDSMCKEGKVCIDIGLKTFAQTGAGNFMVGNVELIGRRKDGSEFPAKLSLSPVKFGGKWNAVGVVKDITQRKQAEQMQREAEQRYHALFDQAPLGVLVVDTETAAFVEFNDVAHLQLGYSREEFGKLTIPDIEAKEPTDTVRSHIAEIVKEGGGEFETEHRTKNGNIRSVLVTTRTFELAGRTFLHAIFHDITEIRKVQNALMESEAGYRQLVELAQEGIWALNNDFTTVFVNPRMAQMLGYTESEMIGKSLFEFLDRGVIEQVKHFLTQFKHSLKGQFVCAFPRKDGTHIDTSIAASTITDDQGQLIGTLALVADITEHKQLEDELRASEERFRVISTSAMDAIILVDEEDKVFYWNPAAERTFGFAEKEAVGKKLADLVILPHGHKNHTVLLQELMHKSFSNRHFEFTGLRKDGTEFPIDLSVASVKLEDKNCMLAIVRDISERKQMEISLKQERDMLEDITENISAGLMLVNKDYQIMWTNKFSKQLHGNVENQTCYSALQGRDTICPHCGIKKIFNGATIDIRESTVSRNGKTRFLEVTATPMKDKDGNTVAALELTMDATEIKKMQGELAKYSQKLEELVKQRTEQLHQTQAKLVKSERLAAIGELAGMVGHDLRNPLTGIKNSAYFLKTKGATISEAQAKEMLETIDKCVEHSNKIVNDLFDYSKEIRLELQETSPRNLLSEAVAMVNVPAKVEILNLIPDEQHLNVDPDKIERVFINLIKNAIDAMPNGGKITIDSKEANGNLEISFADIGTGISDEILPKIFSPLFTTKAQGMGFGLAICKRIIEAHGGTITVKTAKGKGTTFTVTLSIETKPEIGGGKVWINMPESSLSTMTKA